MSKDWIKLKKHIIRRESVVKVYKEDGGHFFHIKVVTKEPANWNYTDTYFTEEDRDKKFDEIYGILVS